LWVVLTTPFDLPSCNPGCSFQIGLSNKKARLRASGYHLE